MNTFFLRSLALTLAAAPASLAFSLYDMAPSVGMPESYAIKYNARMTVAYDDNLNSSSNDKQDGVYAEVGVGAKYSDQESATRISYDVNLGARLYDKAAEGTDRKLFSESDLKATLSHSFGASSVYTTGLTMSLSTEPNFHNSISAPYDQGEYFNWSWSHAYSRAIDSRWSWTASGAYSGQVYTRGSYQEDDRQYLTGALTLSYRYSTLTTYSVSTTYRHDVRCAGEQSDNVYLNAAVDHSLSPASSVYGTLGAQIKMVADNTDLYPNIRFGYRRKLAEGLSANMYFSYDNENIDTGYYERYMYLSNATLRAGLTLNYAYTHKVSFHGGVSVLDRDYSKHTRGLSDRTDTTWIFSVGMRYKFTKRLSGTIDYRYTTCDRSGNYNRYYSGDYERNRISAGVIYTF